MPSIFRSTAKKERQQNTQKSCTVSSRSKGIITTTNGPSIPTTEFGQQTPNRRPPSNNFDSPLPRSPSSPPPILPPKYVFAPTRLPTITSANSIDSFAYSQDEVTRPRHYGLLGGIGAKVTLSLEEVGRVIKVVGKELERRGLTTPMLFSNQALKLSPTRVRALIQSYIDSIRSSSVPRRDAWARDLAFVKEYELGWMLRWTLSRIARIKEGTRVVAHGVLEWEVYEEWRGRERASNYPHDAFPYLSALVPAEVYHTIVSPLLRLLSRFAAHSHLSGLTPHSLSSLFAPFFFDIPTSTPCIIAHAAFVRATYATEHLLLSYIRSSGQGEGLGVTDLPGQLRDWVSGYPTMVASDTDLARAAPRKGSRTVRCERASRIVGAYSKDLIATAETWANDVPEWEAWNRVIWKTRRGEAGRPKFSAAYKRRLVVKDHLPLNGVSPTHGEFAYGRARRPTITTDKRDRSKQQTEDGEEALWGSLAGKEWSMFEEGGFDSPSFNGKKEDIKSRLKFDLNESSKLSFTDRRKTMEWTEFAGPSGGFTRTNPNLDVSLTFAPPISSSITEWPKEREDLNKRLHKSQKEATPFNYDTTPRIGAQIQDNNARPDQHGRVYIEEAFVDWWADWGIGGGWMDRDELTFKEANWAVIEYKARPTRLEDNPRDPLADPRTSDLYFMFEERVPLDYQIAVADPKEKKTLATLFNTRKKRAKESPVKSRVASGWDDSDFDRMLLHREKTKKLSLSRSEPPHASVWQLNQDIKPLYPTKPSTESRPPVRSRTKSNNHNDPHIVEGKASFFSKNRDIVVRRAKSKTEVTGKDKARTKVQKPHEIEFEIHSASGVSSPDNSPRDGTKKGEEKWMDILIANGAKRMDRQDAVSPVIRQAPPVPVVHNHGGLPASPHPPARHPSPSPPRPAESQRAPKQLHSEVDPYAPYNNPVPADYTQHTLETSGSDAEAIVTPHEKGEVQRWPSGKRKPVPPIGMSSDQGVYEEFQQDLSNRLSSDIDPRRSFEPGHAERSIPPIDNRLVMREILQPSPRRDTIHNIVDTYRDSQYTTTSSDLEEQYDSDTATSVRHDPDAEYPVRSFLSEEGEEGLEPPTLGRPLFDLTPGREPSPARYRHGEPLGFVDEEEEEY